MNVIGTLTDLPHVEGREYYVDGTPCTYPAFKPFWEMVNDFHPGRVLSTSYHCEKGMDRASEWHFDAPYLRFDLDIFLIATKIGTEFKTDSGVYVAPVDTVLHYTGKDEHRSPAPTEDLRLLMRIIKRGMK